MEKIKSLDASYDRDNQERYAAIRNGAINEAKINDAFSYLLYGEIDAVLDGLKKSSNDRILLMIALLAQRYYLDPSHETLDMKFASNVLIENGAFPNRDVIRCKLDTWIKESMENIIIKIIVLFGHRLNCVYELMVKDLIFKFPSDRVKLYYCAYIDHEPFIDSDNKRLSTLAHEIARYQKIRRWSTAYVNDGIGFIISALSGRVISLSSKEITCPQEEQEGINTVIMSPLFENICETKLNRDIVDIYPYYGLLALHIQELIREGKIVVRDDIPLKLLGVALKEEKEPGTKSPRVK